MEHGEQGYFPKPEDLSDEDFVRAYPKSGFGWISGEDADKGIWERHKRLEKDNPDIYNGRSSANETQPLSESESKDEQEQGGEELFPNAENLSDKDFVRAFPKSGFGWISGTNSDKKIWERHKRLQKENPDLYHS